MKVVYYGNYLTYFEVGRVEFLRQQGLAMSEVDRRIHLPVVEALVRYRKPARLDDLLEVRCWVSERRRASFRFAYEILDEEGDPVATGSTLHACLDSRARWWPCRPDSWSGCRSSTSRCRRPGVV